jgi:inhibitor of cysteine peptidase
MGWGYAIIRLRLRPIPTQHLLGDLTRDFPHMPTEYTGQNDEITAQVGEEFIIALKSNPTTGYEWEAYYDASILPLVDRRFSLLSPGIGSGGVERFRLRCLAVGETRLRLTYMRRWEKTAAEDIVFRIHVRN